MNKYQKLVQQEFLNDEEAVIKRLKKVYNQSLKDINKSVFELDSSISMLQKALDSIDGDNIGELAAAVLKGKRYYTPEEAQETIKSMLQSKVYQKNYQKALQNQVGGILDTMLDEEFTTVSDYLNICYENGFIGTMFDLQGQGIPLCFPLDQEAMVRAVQLDSKISKGLYTRLGEDVAVLKKKIAAQVSRGISTGMTYQQVAQQLAGTTNIGFNNAVRIARTEGHRIQCQSGMDACYKAKEKGANVVKQWDSTMDSRTRESHTQVDGEIRELDERFSNGLMFPGDPSGGAAEVVNCRCALLQRARWALDEAELQTLQEKAAYFGLDKSDSFEEYKQKYLKAAEKQKVNNSAKGQTQLNGIIQMKDCANFDDLSDYFAGAYPNIHIDDTVKQLDFETVKNALDGCESVMKEFSGLVDSIETITTGNGGVMSCNGGKITFNPHYFSDNKKLMDDCKRMSASRFWVENASPSSIGAHECGHAVEWMMIQKNSAYLYDWQRVDVWNKCTEAKQIVSQACKNIKKTPYGKGKRNFELINGISRYSNKTASETMAEAFADIYANGEKANPLSVEIKRLTLDKVKEYGRGITP